MNLPYMPFFVGDYLKETRHLTTEEHGAYLLLIMQYWVKGGLPDDDSQLARIVNLSLPKWKKLRDVIQAFFYDGWHHEQIDDELVNAAARRDKARKAALAKHSSERAPSMPQGVLERC
jgi:uncharacterized protein YdaU (DUF1376 family)